jgi:hypothetical protein
MAIHGEIPASIMQGYSMSKLTLDYPVYSLDRQLPLPARTTLSKEDLCTLISSSAEHRKNTFLMQFGTVRKDILAFFQAASRQCSLQQQDGNDGFSAQTIRG